jgi:hypothetical protein
MRGSIRGAKRIPLRSPSFLFDDLVFLRISGKSLKSLPSSFSIPTAPTESTVESVAFASREPQIGAYKALVFAPSWPQISA